MPARNILCTLYEYILSEHNAQSENPAEINSIFSRRNDASINKHCISRSLSFFETRDYFDWLLHGDVDAGEKKIDRRKRETTIVRTTFDIYLLLERYVI